MRNLLTSCSRLYLPFNAPEWNRGYLRRSIGQERGGHISPLAAYNADTDQVLILDVSRYKYPPVWVEVEDLWNAVNTVDSVSGLTRGVVVISSKG